MPNALTIQMEARAAGIAVYVLSSGGAFDFDGTAPDDIVDVWLCFVDRKQDCRVYREVARHIAGNVVRLKILEAGLAKRPEICRSRLPIA
jgi:hypothetical protein